VDINLFGSRTLWWWRSSLHERKESWSLPDVTIDRLLITGKREGGLVPTSNKEKQETW